MWATEFVEWANKQLDDRVREALWERGASDEQINLFSIGHVGGQLPEDIEFPEAFLKWSSDGAKLEDVYLFPLTNPIGEVKGFQFRSVERGKKDYMDFFLDKTEPSYFGLGQAMPYIWESESIGVVEGVFDFFPVQRVAPWFIPTITAKVTDLLLRFMKRVVRRVIFFYDADKIGDRATKSFISEEGPAFEEVREIIYPIGVTLLSGKPVKDPGELWEAWGDTKLQPYLRSQLE